MLVPIKAEIALVNRYGSGMECADIAVDYSLLGSVSLLGGEIEPLPFAQRAPLAAGVHLHFILPAGLTRGVQGEGETHYPAVPDRYLVTRIAVDKSDMARPSVTHQAWIVDSSYVGTDNLHSITVPAFDDADNLCRYMGRAYGYDEHPRDGEHIRLTALGMGSATFAASYQECHSVFGFHDPAENLPQGNYIYTVCGWYSDVRQSPLYGLHGEAYAEKLAELGFELADGAVSTEDSSILLHTAMLEVEWRGDSGDYPSGCPHGEVNVAFGNTSAEALSALAAEKLTQEGINGADLERILNILQYDAVGELSGPDGILLAENRIHRRGFDELHTLREWQIIPDDEATVEPAWAGELARLNRLWTQCDNIENKQETKRSELYDVWYSYMMLYGYPSLPFIKKPLTENQLTTELERIDGELTALSQAHSAAISARDEQYNRLAALIGTSCRLEQCNAAGVGQYFSPTAPVVLIAGAGVERGNLFGEEEEVTVRPDSGVITAVRFNLDGKTYFFDGDTLKPFCDAFPPRSDVPQQAQAIYTETLMLWLAADGTARTCEGMPPSAMAMAYFKPTWNPLMLDWRLDMTPTREQVKPDNTMKGWHLGGLDYQYDAHKKTSELKSYSGRMLITPHAAQGLSDAILRNIDVFADEPALYNKLKTIGERAAKLSLLSQKLSGLNENFVGHKQAFQFPIMGASERAKRLAERVRAHMGDYGEVSLNISAPFMPLRAGAARVSNLRIIDTFGRIRQLDATASRMIVAESIREPDGTAMLPPRIVGQTRLQLDWDDTVCGYLMADFLNSRLNLFDESGWHCGVIQLVRAIDGKTYARYSRIDYSGTTAIHKDMRAFVDSMIAQGAGVFERFLELLDERLSSQCLPAGADGQSLPMLVGRPIAMLKAGVTLQSKGELPYSKRFDDFAKRDTFAFEDNPFSLHVGDSRFATEGLMGYFIGGRYDVFYPPYGTKADGDYFCCDNALPIKLNQQPISLTMLVEVYGTVHIRSGVLPMYESTPSWERFKPAMAQIKLYLPFYPVLSPLDVVRIPQLGTADEPCQFYYIEDTPHYRPIVESPSQAQPYGRNCLVDGYVLREPKATTDADNKKEGLYESDLVL